MSDRMIELLILLVIAGLCGSIAQRLAGGRRLGCLASIALGFIGALLGQLIAEKLELPFLFAIRIGNQNFPVVWAVLGASLFAAVLALLTGRNRGSGPPRAG
jgi:uncharacterized membrane protein YeaQ/YmgE (transglycosylase-associated protein family)